MCSVVCSPNRIIGVRGFMVTPDLLPDAPAPLPATLAPPPRELPSVTPPATPVVPATPSAPGPEPTPSDAALSTTSGLLAFSAVGAAVLGAALL